MLKFLLENEMARISLKVGGMVHLGVPCTMAVLECSKELWLVRTSPVQITPATFECPWGMAPGTFKSAENAVLALLEGILLPFLGVVQGTQSFVGKRNGNRFSRI